MPRVRNMASGLVPGAVYIGRPSKWGNPFSHRPGTAAYWHVGSRDEAVRRYEEWLLRQPDLMAALPELRGKDLVCWCHPLSCHGDVLLRLANAPAEGGNDATHRGDDSQGAPGSGAPRP
jgi:Domain of unknown function (DUF4326)